jgi:hypothetical protein
MRKTIHVLHEDLVAIIFRKQLALLFGITGVIFAGFACCEPLITRKMVLTGNPTFCPDGRLDQ